MTTTPKSDSSLNHPELNHLLHRSPHDNRSLCDDRLHHQLHLLKPHGKRHHPVYIAITVDNDTKVTIQNNIFYPLDLEEHLLQLQHGDPWSTWWPVIALNMDTTHGASPFDVKLSDFWIPIRSNRLITNNICPAMSSNYLQHNDQQLRHRHRYDFRYGHDSPCPPSTDHSTKTTALFSTETAKQEL